MGLQAPTLRHSRQLLQINLTLDSVVVTFLFVLLGAFFGFPIVYYLGTPQPRSQPRADARAVDKATKRFFELQKERRAKARERAGRGVQSGGFEVEEESSSSDSEEEWDIEHVLGERIPRPKWCADPGLRWLFAQSHGSCRAEGDPTQQARNEEAHAPRRSSVASIQADMAKKPGAEPKRGEGLTALARAPAKAAK